MGTSSQNERITCVYRYFEKSFHRVRISDVGDIVYSARSLGILKLYVG